MNRKRRLIQWGFFLALFLTFAGLEAQAATITSSGAGNWSEPGTWAGSTVPTATDDVVIDHAVVLDGDFSCKSLTINAGDNLKPEDYTTVTLTVNGNITVNATGYTTYKNANGGLLNLVIAGTSTVTVGADANNGTPLGLNINDLEIQGTVVPAGNYIINVYGNFAVTNGGSFTAATGTIKLYEKTAGQYTEIINNSTASTPITFYQLTCGNADLEVITRDDFSVAYRMTLTAGCTFNASAGEVTMTGVYNATDPDVINNATNDATKLLFYDLTFNTSVAAFTPDGDDDYTIQHYLTNDGTSAVTAAGGTLIFNSGTSSAPSKIIDNGGDITVFDVTLTGSAYVEYDYTSSTGQTLTLAGTALTLASGSTLDLSVADATTGSTLDITGVATIDLNSATDNLIVDNLTTTAATALSNGSIKVYGKVLDAAAFTFSSAALNFYGSSQIDLGNANSPCGAINVYGTLTMLDNLIETDLTTTSAIITIKTGGTLVGGDYHCIWPAATATVVFIFETGSTLSTNKSAGILCGATPGNGFLQDDGPGELPVAEWTSSSGANLIFNGNHTALGIPSTDATWNDVTINCGTGALVDVIVDGVGAAADGTLTVAGDLTLNDNGAGSIVIGASDVIVMSGSHKTLTTTTTVEVPTVDDLTISGIVTTATDLKIGGTLTISSGGSFKASAGTVTMLCTAAGENIDNANTNDYNVDSLSFYNLTITPTNAAGVTVTANSDFEVKNDFTQTTGNPITFDATSVLKMSGGTVGGTAASLVSNALADVLIGTLHIPSGANVSTEEVTVLGYGTQTAGATTYNGIVVDAGGVLSTAATTTEINFSETNAADVYIVNNGTLSLGTISAVDNANCDVVSTSNFTITGDITHAGAGSLVCSTPSVVTFSSTAAQTATITATGTITFYDVIINNSHANGLTTDGANQTLTINGDLTVNAGCNFKPEAGDDIAFSGGTTQTILVDGTYSGANMTIGANTTVKLYGDYTTTFDNGAGAIDLSTTSAKLECYDGTVTVNNATATIALGADDQLYLDNLTITDAAATVITGAFHCYVKGNITGADADDDTKISADRVYFIGDGDQTLTESGSCTELDFTQLTVNKPSGNLILASDINITGTAAGDLTITKGGIDLQAYWIDLPWSANAILSEQPGYTVFNSLPSTTAVGSQGYIRCNNYNTNGGNACGLGIDFGTACDDFASGNEEVRRYHTSRSITGGIGISRVYYVVGDAADGTPTTANPMYIYYDDSEVPGGSEADLEIWSSAGVVATSFAGTYAKQATHPTTGANNTTLNYVSLNATAQDYNPGLCYTLVIPSANVKRCTTSGNWSADATWSPSGVPTSSDIVLITGGYTVTLDQDAEVAGLVFNTANSTLQPSLSGEYTLTNTGDLKFDISTAYLKGTNGAGKMNYKVKGGTAAQPKKIELVGSSNMTVNDLIYDGYSKMIGNYNLTIYGDVTLEKITTVPNVQYTTGTLYFDKTGTQTITKDAAATLKLNDITVNQNSTVTTEESFELYGDLTTTLTGKFQQTAGTISFVNTTSTASSPQLLTNGVGGTLQLYTVEVDSNVVVEDNTSTSDITIAGDLTVGATGVFDVSSGGTVKFSNIVERTITNNAANDSTALKFKDIQIISGSKVTTASNFIIEDDGGIETLGTGSFIATAGKIAIYAQDANPAIMANSTSGTLKLYNLDIADANKVTTATSFVIQGNLWGGATPTGELVASAGEITFDNSAKTDTIIGGSDLFKFYDLKIADESKLFTDDDFQILRHLTIEGNGELYASAGEIEFTGGRGRNLTNSGKCTFYDLKVDGTSTSNVLNTTSDFTVTHTLTAGASATAGALKATGNSTITVGGSTGASITLTSDQPAALQFMNVKIVTAMTQAANKDFYVKGDFIDNAGFTTSTNDVDITFNGSSEQTISGLASVTTRFGDVIVDNASGVKLEKSISVYETLTLTEGDINLNGDNVITLVTAGTSKLSESAGNTVVNNKPGSGYIYLATATETQLEASGLGISVTPGTVAPATYTVSRYSNPVNIVGSESIERYYNLTFAHGSNPLADIVGVAVSYDNTELNSNDDDYLTIFKATSDTTSSWTGLEGVPSPGTDGGAVTKATGIASTVFSTTGEGGTSQFVAVAQKGVTVAANNNVKIDSRNATADNPLILGADDQVIMVFSLESNGYSEFTAMDIIMSVNPSSKLENFELYADDDNNIVSYGRTKLADGSVSGTTIQFGGFTEVLSANTPKYYFLIADVSNSVNSSTPAIRATFTDANLTFTETNANTVSFAGPSFSFDELETTLSTANTPVAGYITKSGTTENVFGFTLTVPEGVPSFNITKAIIDVDIDNGAADANFENFKLYVDKNQNSRYDAMDIQFGSTLASPTNDQLTFSGTQAVTETIEFIMIVDVKGGAPTNGTIQGSIASSNNVELSAGANVASGTNFAGNVHTIADSVNPTKLKIVDIIPDSRIAANDGLPANTLVEEARFTMIVQAVDANDRPQKVGVFSPATALTVTKSGTSDLVCNTTTPNMSADGMGYNSLVYPNLLFRSSTGNGEIGMTITVADDNGNLTSITSDAYTILAKEPTFSMTGLTLGSITNSSCAISWNNPNTDNCIVVVSPNAMPTAPADGTEYNAATSNNYSTPNSTNGTTATNNVVVYKGASSSPQFTVTGLTAETKYYVQVYNYKGTGATTNYLTEAYPVESVVLDSFYTNAAEPTTPPSTLVYSDVTDTGMTLQWTRGTGEYCIVVARQGTTAVATNPVDKTTYTANATFGDPDSKLGAAFVVYNGASNSVSLTGLVPNTQYNFAVYEYSGEGEKIDYLTTPLSGNRMTLETEPDAQASEINFSDVTLGTNTTIKVNWTNGTGYGRVVLAKAGSAIEASEYPVDGTMYFDDSLSTDNYWSQIDLSNGYKIGSAYVIWSSHTDTNSVTVSGLTYGQTYYFRVFEYNGTAYASADTTINYLTSSATNNPDSRAADSYESNDALASAKLVTANSGAVQGIISSATDEDWLYFTPNTANSENNIRLRLTDVPYNYTVELYNSSGRLLRRSKRTSTNDEIIVVNNVPAGDYYVKIYSEDGNYSLTPYRVNVLTSQAEYMSVTP